MNCVHCGSDHTQSKGLRESSTSTFRRYKCVSCSKTFSIPIESVDQDDLFDENPTFVRPQEWIDQILKSKTFVITSVQSNVDVDDEFFRSLVNYSKVNKAELILLPIRHSAGEGSTRTHIYDDHVHDFMVENNFKLHERLKVLGALKINATAENPLTGLNAISKGDSVIVGHNQLQMTTLPNNEAYPIIMTSTGTVSSKLYSQTKQGYKAGFNHANSAVVVELDGDIFHIRHLNWDGEGFYDLDTYYDSRKAKYDGSIAALVTGDEHAIFADPKVKEATYMAKDSMANTLMPAYVVRHDLLDCYSVSHHHQKDVFIQYSKYQSGLNKVEDELNRTIQHVVETSPKGAINLIVSSNHNDHLTRWLNEADPKLEPWNAVVYHKLMYQMLSMTTSGDTGAEYPNPFELYCEDVFADAGVEVEFLGRRQVYKIEDVEIANHGDRGANGARGSRKQFAQLPTKTIIGHSHSPGIEKGCYQVGTSSYLNLEYANGPSSWMNTHCIIHNNGKRQLINIIDGKWRRKKK